MNGTSPEIKNHSTNELPFIRPTTPPARPKNSMITIRPMPAMGRPSPDERLDCPEHGDHHDLRGCGRSEHAHMIGPLAKAHIGPGYKVPQAACAARPASSNAVRVR